MSRCLRICFRYNPSYQSPELSRWNSMKLSEHFRAKVGISGHYKTDKGGRLDLPLEFRTSVTLNRKVTEPAHITLERRSSDGQLLVSFAIFDPKRQHCLSVYQNHVDPPTDFKISDSNDDLSFTETATGIVLLKITRGGPTSLLVTM